MFRVRGLRHISAEFKFYLLRLDASFRNSLHFVLHSARVSPTPFTLRKKAEGPYPWLDDYLTMEVPQLHLAFREFGFRFWKGRRRVALLHLLF